MKEKERRGYYVAYSFETKNGELGIGSISVESTDKINTNKDINGLAKFIEDDMNYKSVAILNFKRITIKDEVPEGFIPYTGKPNYGLMCTNGEFKTLDEVIEDHPKLAEGFKDDKEWSSLFERELKALKELKEVTKKMYELDVKAGEEIAEQIANGTF